MFTDPLNEDILRSALCDGSNLRIKILSECDSTNMEARREALAGCTIPCLIVAESQSAGKGRMGRQFCSPAGTGIYMSLLFPLSGTPANAVGVTCASAVAVMRAIRSVCGKETQIKWVNDLFYDGKKVCGILAESFSVGEQAFLVIGIGINLRPVVFPPELAGIAGTLNDEHTPRAHLIAGVIQELFPFLSCPDDRSWIADYRSYSRVIGQQIRWTRDGVTQEGYAKDIDSDGGLIVLSPSGAETILCSGEISVRIKS